MTDSNLSAEDTRALLVWYRSLDYGVYARGLRINAAGLVAYGRRIVHQSPAELPPALAESLAQFSSALEKLEASRARSLARVDRKLSPRDADTELDRVWGAFASRLRSLAELAPESGARAERAADLYQQIFPAGLGFLRLAFGREWEESARRLRLIHDESLAAELDELLGPEFLGRLERAHQAYGMAIGITAGPSEDSGLDSLRELKSAADRALAQHCRRVIGFADERDPRTLALAKAALRPIDEAWRSLGRRPSARRSAEAEPQGESDASLFEPVES